MTNAAFEFDTFLSHNSKDKPAVEQIARILQDEYKLKIWLDAWELIPGRPWQEALEKGLNKSKTVAVFLGEAGFGNWENEEMRVAVDTRVGKSKTRVIPVLLPGVRDNPKMSAFLKRYTWVDLRGGYDAKDLLYRLYCGITGTPPGDKDNVSKYLGKQNEILTLDRSARRLISSAGEAKRTMNSDRSQSAENKKPMPGLRATAPARESNLSAFITSVSSEQFDNMKNQLSKLEGYMQAYIIWNERVTMCEDAKSRLVDGMNINWVNITPGSNNWIRYWSQVKNLLKQALMGEIPDSLMSDEIKKHSITFHTELDRAVQVIDKVTNETIYDVLAKAQAHIEDASSVFHPVLNDFKNRALAGLTQIQTQIKAIIESNEPTHMAIGEPVSSRERPRNLQPSREPERTAIQSKKAGKALSLRRPS